MSILTLVVVKDDKTLCQAVGASSKSEILEMISGAQ